MKIILEEYPVDIHSEDSGQAKIAEISTEKNDVFVRIYSWSEDKDHEQFNSIIDANKKIRVTIEAID
jgi:hypothetical protein